MAIEPVPVPEEPLGDVSTYLPDCINSATRMLEPILNSPDTSSMFVDRGGVQLLLNMYKLPHLPAVFGSSSASHGLLTAFRSFAPQHAPVISKHLRDALGLQLAAAIDSAKVWHRQERVCTSWQYSNLDNVDIHQLQCTLCLVRHLLQHDVWTLIHGGGIGECCCLQMTESLRGSLGAASRVCVHNTLLT